MQLESIKYSQYAGSSQEWYLEKFALTRINLIVGKNATGKSRTLNIIKGLANLVSGQQKLIFVSGDYDVTFKKEAKKIWYALTYEDAKISNEELAINDKVLLKRKRGGKGVITAVELKKNNMKFQMPENQLACVARRDSLQHPFFDHLYKWGKSLSHYYFGAQMGKDSLAVPAKGSREGEVNFKDTNRVVEFFKNGLGRHGKSFVNTIKDEMEQIGYRIRNVTTSAIGKLVDGGGNTITLEGLAVQEADLKGITNQAEMSQGMFRALSLIIQINFSLLEKTPDCILIDDIGEGLDYERSTTLIKILIEKAEGSKIQLIMSTNDRFVMNTVPLEYWHIIQRSGQKSKIFNYVNSKNIFDDFKSTGLNNFDFLSTEFYLKGFSKK